MFHSKNCFASAVLHARRVCLLVVPLSLVGCASLSDFQRMLPEQRADLVCASQPDYNAAKRALAALDEKISAATAALARGYRVHRQCQQVRVYDDVVTTCTRYGQTTQCRQTRPARWEEQCRETPVPIDAKLERDNRTGWQQARQLEQTRMRQLYAQCFARVVKLTPEDAYRLY